MRRILFAPVLAAGLLGGHAPALAQGLPASLFTATGAIGAPEETMLLRRFALTESEGRMAGEHARLSIPVYLRPQEMGARAVVQIGLETAISVMPEASLIEVRFNDTPIGSSSLVGSGARRRIAHEVPQGLLRPGWNLVTLTTRQRHRVDCSTAATYELWSQIDPETSGLLIGTHDAGLQSLTDLASLVPGRDGRHRLRAVLPEGASAETVNLSVRAISLLASRLGFNEPVVDVAHTTGSGPGLDVIMGPRGQLAALGAGRIPDEGAIAVYDDASHERFQLVIAASGPRAASQAVGILERLPAQQDALGVLNAPLLEPQTSVTFAELGEDSREFDGRLYETRFQVRFPSDFFPSDVGRVAIRLSGAYAPGLSQDSQLTVRVNGAVAGALALGREDGAVFSEQAVYVSLAAFRPGLNMVEIEAQLVHPDDAVCLPSVMLDSPTRFLILSESSINVPRYPRIARVPRLTQGFQLDVLG
ncbi:MAG: cellulose biosynthesis cyclic di-GMP-binding regulatory protein BcsB, partial [Hyphomicrobiaceae bacterium]|nr:cellulose biosynthesis cyclic di-GMP-binding regulatory protein BcsB [Hyphomicrobiaceae bacterium]